MIIVETLTVGTATAVALVVAYLVVKSRYKKAGPDEALKLYNEAGLSIEALKVLPDIAAAISEPLSRAGTTTIISQGNGAGAGTGAAKLTEDVVQVLSQLGPILRQLAGVDLDDFIRGIAALPGATAQNLASRVAQSDAPPDQS